jgi:hypothetical protein
MVCAFTVDKTQQELFLPWLAMAFFNESRKAQIGLSFRYETASVKKVCSKAKP